MVNRALSSLACSRLLGVEYDVKGNGKMCACCGGVEGQGVLGLKVEASLSTSISAKVWVGPSVNWKQAVGIPGLTKAEATIFGGIGAETGLTGFATLKAGAQCLWGDPQMCLEEGGSTPPISLVAR